MVHSIKLDNGQLYMEAQGEEVIQVNFVFRSLLMIID